ncbi:DUF4386 domain-containing protein [Cellulomonas hominis]|uniref:DUF4386 domain-containing protein n=1 Tax=Cellulomonas hominis TaxID=156981 RepID=UPI001BA0A71D|nr:DUF4386 domain-containing protein [Cellulomonas hominis]VTR76523.1 hypothetical protein CHMI_01284 [Cellulomonas hominis]
MSAPAAAPAPAPAPSAVPAAATPYRGTARLAGALYLLTFVASIAALPLLGPVLDDPAYVLGAGADGAVTAGALLDLVNALACVGTAVVLFPVVRRWGEHLALGFVASRLVEAAVIAIGVVSLLAVVSLRQEVAPGTDDAARVAVAQGLVAVRDWTFLLGPGVMAAVNALLLAPLMLRSGLVPRAIPVAGLVGAPLLLVSDLATAFGVNEQLSAASAVAVAPVFVWELSLGLWLLVKGFRPVTAPAGQDVAAAPER